MTKEEAIQEIVDREFKSDAVGVPRYDSVTFNEHMLARVLSRAYEAGEEACEAEVGYLRKIVRGVLANITRNRKMKKNESFWARVRDACAVGSTSAKALCVEMGFDPETGERIDDQAPEDKAS